MGLGFITISLRYPNETTFKMPVIMIMILYFTGYLIVENVYSRAAPSITAHEAVITYLTRGTRSKSFTVFQLIFSYVDNGVKFTL